LLSKENYKRLQKICKEINEIMLESELNEVTIQTQYKDWHYNENKGTIWTRKYHDGGSKTISNQIFNSGTIIFSIDKKEYLPEYKWNYEV